MPWMITEWEFQEKWKCFQHVYDVEETPVKSKQYLNIIFKINIASSFWSVQRWPMHGSLIVRRWGTAERLQRET
jgi:hypothetical protein